MLDKFAADVTRSVLRPWVEKPVQRNGKEKSSRTQYRHGHSKVRRLRRKRSLSRCTYGGPFGNDEKSPAYLKKKVDAKDKGLGGEIQSDALKTGKEDANSGTKSSKKIQIGSRKFLVGKNRHRRQLEWKVH